MAGTPLELGPTQLAGGAGTAIVHDGGERLAAGARAGEYVIERLVGAGAMGEVYAGSHPVIGKRVAVKVLRRELAASPEAAERFIREARAVNQVDHPNVVDVFAFGRLDDGRLYLVMDLVDGESLRAALADGPLELGAALDVLAAIAGALDAAHARGVVHRDLKPDNIVIAAGTGNVFVLDFGIAKLVSAAGTAGAGAAGTLTGQGTWLGTPGYMAPEQWSADGAGPASDRYALGVIAFEVLTGAQPFTAASVPAMMEQHFRAEIPTLSSRRATLPVAYDAVIARALAKDPAARFPTAIAMVDALRASATTGQGARPAITTAAGATASARRTWVPAAAGVGVLGLMVAGWATLRAGDHDDEHDAHGAHATTPAAGTTRIDVMSDPDQAQVTRDGRLLGTTPTTLALAAGERENLELRKPGYLPVRRTIGAADGEVVHVALPIVSGFDGVWQLPSGELRAFERHRDDVVVYKVDSVGGERHYYRRFEFEPVAGSVVRFAAEEELIGERAPDDPSCHIPLRVQYDYDPAADALELRREHVELGFEAGHCVVQTRTMPEPVQPRRVDHTRGDTISIDAPAGIVTSTLPITKDDTQLVRGSKDATPNFGKGTTLTIPRLKQIKQAIAKQAASTPKPKPVPPPADPIDPTTNAADATNAPLGNGNRDNNDFTNAPTQKLQAPPQQAPQQQAQPQPQAYQAPNAAPNLPNQAQERPTKQQQAPASLPRGDEQQQRQQGASKKQAD